MISLISVLYSLHFCTCFWDFLLKTTPLQSTNFAGTSLSPAWNEAWLDVFLGDLWTHPGTSTKIGSGGPTQPQTPRGAMGLLPKSWEKLFTNMEEWWKFRGILCRWFSKLDLKLGCHFGIMVFETMSTSQLQCNFSLGIPHLQQKNALPEMNVGIATPSCARPKFSGASFSRNGESFLREISWATIVRKGDSCCKT